MGAMIQMHYIYCAVLFLLLWHQLHLRSSGIRSLEEFSSLHWSWCAVGQGMKKELDTTEWLNWTELNPVKGIGLINKAEVDVFLEFPCFFYNPTDVGNFISGSSAFSKSSLNIWKFPVQVLLKPGLENFEHYSAGVRRVQLCRSLNILWHCPSLGLEQTLTTGLEKVSFQWSMTQS